MICALLRKCGIRVFSEDEIIQGIKDLQAEQEAQAQPAAVLSPVQGRGEFVKVNTHLRRDK